MDRRQFIYAAGSCVAAMTGPRAGAVSAHPGGVGDEDRLMACALAAFKRFEEIWNFNDFWKRGNTGDACVTFADAAIQRWPQTPAIRAMQSSLRDMLAENLAYFDRFDPGGLWADDFGWWGLMALNARRHLLRQGEKELAHRYQALATDLCWEYKRKTAYDHSPTARPVPHGCRNGDANGVSRGVKNTVTNVLLLLLSTRIYRMTLAEHIPDNDKYLEMAYRQWGWFESWFTLDRYQYLKPVFPSGALVQERPLARFEGSDYVDRTHPPWSEGWVWSGDQGMLAAALTDLHAVRYQLAAWLKQSQGETGFDADAFGQRIRELIRLLGNGISAALIGDQDGIIREAPCAPSFGPAHGNDYLAGRGIMMRYLGSPEIRDLLGKEWADATRATTNAIWNTRDKANDQFQPEFTRPENDRLYIEQFRRAWGSADEVVTWDIATMKEQNKQGVCQSIGLDALGAAIRML